MVETNKTYLGDGLFASFDGYQIWLRTERYDQMHEVALEPEVLVAFLEYVDRVMNEPIKE